MYLVSSDKTPAISNKIVLTFPGPSYSTNLVSPIGGKWYYEFVHIGGNRHHVVGYAVGKNYLYFYHSGRTDTAFFYGYFHSASWEYINLNWPEIKIGDTVGISIDADNCIISAHCKGVTRSQSFIKIQGSSVSMTTWEGNYNGMRDELNFNFGREPFTYSIPHGFKAWDQTKNQESKKNKHIHLGVLFSSSSSFFIIILVSE